MKLVKKGGDIWISRLSLRTWLLAEAELGTAHLLPSPSPHAPALVLG